MELEKVKTLDKPTINRLRAARLNTVEELALVDVRNRKVNGITSATLAQLRRDAQATIFQNAVQRVSVVAGEAYDALEDAIERASKATLEAARLAQARAKEAVAAARERTQALAHVAAVKTSEATRAAEKEYGRLRQQLRKIDVTGRKTLVAYERRAHQAAQAAKRAQVAAKEAAASAAARVQKNIQKAARRSKVVTQKLAKRTANGTGKAATRARPKAAGRPARRRT